MEYDLRPRCFDLGYLNLSVTGTEGQQLSKFNDTPDVGTNVLIGELKITGGKSTQFCSYLQ